MTSSALPDNWRELLAGYVLGDLDADQQRLVQQWLAADPAVAAELTVLEETWHALPQALPQQAPPADLAQRLAAAISAPPSSTAIPLVRRRRPTVWVLSSGWAATAIALIVLGIENQQLRQEKLQSEAVVASFSQPQNLLYTLAGTETEPAASGRLAIDPAAELATIATYDLPSLPEDQVYRLWALADAEPIFCGQFNPADGAAINQWQLPNPGCATAPVQMLVTSESIAAPPQPQGPLVLQPQS